MKRLPCILIALLSWLPLSALLANTVDAVLRAERPAGVVFEIIGSSKAMLDQRLPQLHRDIQRLRDAFPGRG